VGWRSCVRDMHGLNILEISVQQARLYLLRLPLAARKAFSAKLLRHFTKRRTSQKYCEHARNRENTKRVARTDPGTVAMKILFQDRPIFKRPYLIGRPRF